MQTKLMSFVESWANVLIGFVVSFVSNMLILPLFGFRISISDNLIIGVIYTAISVVRSYCVRRFFNRIRNV